MLYCVFCAFTVTLKPKQKQHTDVLNDENNRIQWQIPALAWNISTCVTRMSPHKAHEYEYNILNIMCKMKKVLYFILCTFGITAKLKQNKWNKTKAKN